MSAIIDRAKTIFLEACDKVDSAERAAFLDAACAGDSKLRRRVERLLVAHREADSLFDRTDSIADSTWEEPTGQMIGPFKILQKIGEGGMGVVYMAEQKVPVKRRVALKIIKPGMDTRQVLARFEAERQALAMMDHPNIARVLEAGTTDSGRPYFVMELVKGVPITDFCDSNKLRPRARLKLFVDVCHAVQHAHQKGIIHRDLKPSNVLVAKFDDNPVIKVIDFGVAKATNHELTDRTMFTQFGQVVGTIEYMSPEQAQLNQLDVDTRSDIYALGVLLYELLVGTTPFDRLRLRTAALDEVLRIIREEDPPKPSTRLSTLGDDVTDVSANRKTNATALGKAIRGDIDLIVMKALDKERSRRYETAIGFAADVQRYLDGEVVEARAPSSWYRLHRLASRNRGAVLAASAVLVAIAIGLTSSVVAMKRAKNAARNAIESQRRMLDSVAAQRELLKEQVLLAIMGGDHGKAIKQQEMAGRLHVSDEWMAMMNGLSQFLQGDPNRAAETLNRYKERIDASPAGFALVANVYSQQGNEEELFQRLARLRDMPRASFKFEDYLLVGWAISRWLPQEATEDLQVACQLNESSLIPRMLLGQARCWLASSLEDRSLAIETVKLGIKDLDSIRHLLPNDVKVASEHALGRLTLGHLLQLSGKDADAKAVLDSQRAIVDELGQYREHNEAVWTRAMYLLLCEENETVLGDFEARRRDQAGVDEDYLAMFLPSVCLRLGQLERGQAIFAHAEPELQRQAGAIDYFLELSKPTAATQRHALVDRFARELEERTLESSSNVLRFMDWTVFKMLGEHVRAKQIAEILYESSVSRNLWSEEIACADFMRGQRRNPDALLESCRNSQTFTAYAHMVIAVDAMSGGDRNQAKHHFRAACQTSDFQNTFFWWSRAFLARVDDTQWLPWL